MGFLIKAYEWNVDFPCYVFAYKENFVGGLTAAFTLLSAVNHRIRYFNPLNRSYAQNSLDDLTEVLGKLGVEKEEIANFITGFLTTKISKKIRKLNKEQS